MPNQFNTYGGQLTIGSRLKQTIINPGKDQTRELDLKTETVYVSQASDFGNLVGGFYEVLHNPTGLSSSTATIYQLTGDVSISSPLKIITTGNSLIVISLNNYSLTYTGVSGALFNNQANSDLTVVIDGGYGGRLITPAASGGAIFGFTTLNQLIIGDTGILTSKLGTITSAATVSIVTTGLYLYVFNSGLTFLNVASVNLNVITAQLLSTSGGTANSNQVIFTLDGTTTLIGSASSLIIVDAQSTHSVFEVKNSVPISSFYVTSSGFFGVSSPTYNNLFRSTEQSPLTTSTLDVVDFDPFENVSPFAFLFFSNNTTATTGTANTDRVIQGITSKNLQFFTDDSSTGTLTYTGLRPVVFTIESLLSITGTTGNTVTLYVFYNGTAFAYLPDVKLSGTTDPVSIAFRFVQKLLPNDTIRIAIRVDSAQSVTVKNYNVLIK